MSHDGYASRKFWLTVAVLLISAVGFLTGKMDGGTWVAAATLILGVSFTANVMEKKQ